MNEWSGSTSPVWRGVLRSSRADMGRVAAGSRLPALLLDNAKLDTRDASATSREVSFLASSSVTVVDLANAFGRAASSVAASPAGYGAVWRLAVSG